MFIWVFEIFKLELVSTVTRENELGIEISRI